jgi:hypothetical protein
VPSLHATTSTGIVLLLLLLLLLSQLTGTMM